MNFKSYNKLNMPPRPSDRKKSPWDNGFPSCESIPHKTSPKISYNIKYTMLR